MNAAIERSTEESFAAGIGFLAGILIVGCIVSVLSGGGLGATTMLAASALPLAVAGSLGLRTKNKMSTLKALRYTALGLPTMLAICALVGFAPVSVFGFVLSGGALLAFNMLLATALTSLVFGLFQLGETKPMFQGLEAKLKVAPSVEPMTRWTMVPSVSTQKDLDEFDQRLRAALRSPEVELDFAKENEVFSQHFEKVSDNISRT